MKLQHVNYGITVPIAKFAQEPGDVFTLKVSDLGLPTPAIPESIEMDFGKGNRHIFRLIRIERDNGEFVCALYTWATLGWRLKVQA